MAEKALNLEMLETLPDELQKKAVRSLLLSPISDADEEDIKKLFKESRSQVSRLPLSVLEALSSPHSKDLSSESIVQIELFRDELLSHLQGTYGNHPRKLHAILYTMGFPTDIGCG